MAKIEKKDAESSAPPAEPVGINTGVAIIGFILCFLAGAMPHVGLRPEAHPRSGEHRRRHEGAGRPELDRERLAHPRLEQGPDVGLSARAGHHRPLLGLPVPVLLHASRRRWTQVKNDVRPGQGPHLLEERAAADSTRTPSPPPRPPWASSRSRATTRFWKFHDTAFKNQGALGRDSYEKWAKEAGVDMAKFKAGLDAHTWAKKVDDDHAVAQKVGVNGTPATLHQRHLVSGAQPFDKFKAVIDQELQKAQAKIAAGTPKDKIYVGRCRRRTRRTLPRPPRKRARRKTPRPSSRSPSARARCKGNPNALVTIIEFSDFQCPYCKRVEPTLKAIFDKYGDKVRFVWKNEPLPFHPRAEPAAEVAMEARAEKGDKGFWDAHDKLFDVAAEARRTPTSRSVAKDLGLDLDKVRRR